MGLSLEPDLVVQAFFIGNDIYDDLASSETELTFQHPLKKGGVRTLLAQSVFIQWIFTKISSVKYFDQFLFDAGLRYADRGIFLKDMPETEKKAWNRSLETLSDTRDILREMDIAYRVAIIPTSDQVRYGSYRNVNEDYRRPNDILARFFSENEIIYLDLLPIFQQVPLKYELYYSRDLHWTATGHRIVAAKLATWIAQYQMCD